MFASCADLLQAYPTTLKPVTLELLLPTLTERWTNHLFNQIWLVCDDAARALERALHAYPSTLEPVILELLKENIVCAKNQPPADQFAAVQLLEFGAQVAEGRV